LASIITLTQCANIIFDVEKYTNDVILDEKKNNNECSRRTIFIQDILPNGTGFVVADVDVLEEFCRCID
jgi:hypothetical protein